MPTTQTSLLSFFAKGKGQEGQGGNKRKQQQGENIKKNQDGKNNNKNENNNNNNNNNNRSAKNKNDNEKQRKRRKTTTTSSKEAATERATPTRATTKQRTMSLDEENQQDESSTLMKRELSLSCLKEGKLEAAGVGKVEEVQDQRANDDGDADHDKESITTKADPTSTGNYVCDSLDEGEKGEEKSSREDEDEDEDDSSSSSSDEDSDTDIEDKEQNDTPTNDDNDNIDENDNDNLCEYEKLRLRNIQRNNARLAALGLLKPGEATGGQQFWPNNKNVRKVKRKKANNAPKANKTSTLPTRRSGRIRKTILRETDAAATTTTTSSSSFSAETNVEELPPEEEVLVEYTVSPLLQYSITDEMEVDSSSDSVAAATKSNTCTTTKEEETEAVKMTTGNLSTLSPVGRKLCPPKGLNAIYSLDFWSTTTADNRNSWLVGAGKSGIITLWDTSNNQKKIDMNNDDNDNDDDDDMIHPVFSWKGHSGRWISGAKLLSTSSRSSPTTTSTTTTSTPSRLLTSSNDGAVCLWDLTKVTTTSNVPKLLYQTSKDLHRSGIFAMDVLQEGGTVRVCTGSKDTTIAVHSVDDHSSVLWRSDYHSGKVGSVQWQGTDGSTLLASASDDGLVAIHDYRITGCVGGGGGGGGGGGKGTEGVVAEIGNAHARPHSVVWDMSSDHRFLTAGQDPVIKLWDIRNTSQPVTTLQGHVPSNSRCKGIHHPVFYKYGRTNFVLTGGDGSGALSMFSLNQQNNGESSSSNNKTTTSGTLYSRGLLPLDCGDASAIAVGDSAATTTKVAVSVAGGEVLLLEPKLSRV